MHMRKKIVAGNWKMNKDISSAVELAGEIALLAQNNQNLSSSGKVGMIVCPSFVLLPAVMKELEGNSFVHVGAQNCHAEEKGAFTGEVSAAMLRSLGVEYVIIGHSERRTFFKEDNAFLKKKVMAALSAGLKPIFCCGEVLAEREAGDYFEVVRTQLKESVFDLAEEEFQKVIIAYEPGWAIGTGITATPAQAQEMHAFIRRIVKDKYGEMVASETLILYGGSCNAANAAELFSMPDVDGGLIGGASLKANDFIEIAGAAASV
jgi:triosephosphate isomerase (TIM)